MASTLVLIRHAKSSWRPPIVPDFDRGLSGRGVRDGRRFGRRLIRELPAPDLVLCSTARRTRDTLACLVPELVDPRRVRYEDALYHATATTLLEHVRATPPDVGTLFVIAHNPGLTDLFHALAAEGTGDIGDLPTFGCAIFTLPTDFANATTGDAILKIVLRPKDGTPRAS